jgi:MFS family permease
MPHRRSAAMSLVLAGSSIGGILVPAIVWGFANYGWRDTVMAIGIFTIAAGPPIAFIFARRAPDNPPEPVQRSATTPVNRFVPAYDFTVRQALRTRAFWSLTLAHTMTNLSVSAVSAHVFLHLTDPVGVNLSRESASSVLPIMAGAAVAFQLLGGFFGDRVYKPAAVSVLALIQGASIIVLAFAGAYWVTMVFAVAWGLGFGGRTPLLHAMRGEYFGRKHYGTILGLSAFPMAIGMTVTPYVVGRVFDIQGTYQYAFLTLAALSVIASVAILFAKKPTPPGTG